MQRRPLGNTGITVSALGYGAASLGEEYGPIDLADSLRVVPEALAIGIDLFDTSPYYGRGASEVLLGHALRGVPRDRYHLSTKLGRYDQQHFDFSPRRVRESVDTSLVRLRTDHLDLVLCHDVEFVEIDRVIAETLPTLRSLQREGKVRAVGASAYPIAALRRMIVDGDVDVVLGYGSLTLHNRQLEELLPLCAERGVGVLHAAPFDMGLLTDSDPPAWHPATPELRAAVCRARALCAAQGDSLARIAFRFAVDHGGPAATIVGTAFVDQVRAWDRWLREPVDPTLVREVGDLLQGAPDAVRTVGLPENN
ncbi:MAG: aldo/keto reductase [Planctomycetes bacterium]|nr:aldo/keto reductase [Planctomycetota bacterium]